MYVCMHACMDKCARARVCVCVCLFVCEHMYVHAFFTFSDGVILDPRACTHTHTHGMHAHKGNAHTCMHAHTRTHMYAGIHACMHHTYISGSIRVDVRHTCNIKNFKKIESANVQTIETRMCTHTHTRMQRQTHKHGDKHVSSSWVWIQGLIHGSMCIACITTI
jgi:hypothetical protein